jgi:ferrochelatase
LNALVTTGPIALAATASRRGVVLVNVGTPDAPTPKAVRAYLREFLGDPRVVDLPAPARWALLNLVVLPFRPRKSAHAYQQVWTEEGSPLLVHSRAQAAGIAAHLPEAEVVLAMRYGQPSLARALERLRERGIDDVTLVPMYPQEASATTGTTVEEWRRLAGETRVLPAFFALPGFVSTVAANLRQTLTGFDADHVLFSYHGLPVRQIARGCGGVCAAGTTCPDLCERSASCYRAQCFATTARVTAAAGPLPQVSTAFQSRLKGDAWIRPFTDETLEGLAARGVKRVAVVCPSFVADCLETLEEIAIRGAETFRAAGGEALRLVPAVNEAPEFLAGLAGLIRAQWMETNRK